MTFLARAVYSSACPDGYLMTGLASELFEGHARQPVPSGGRSLHYQEYQTLSGLGNLCSFGCMARRSPFLT